METETFLIKSPHLEIYQTDDPRKWIGIYLHACRSRNLAAETIEFYAKKLNAFVQFRSQERFVREPLIPPPGPEQDWIQPWQKIL